METTLSFAVVLLFTKVADRAIFTQLDSGAESWIKAIYKSSVALDVTMRNSVNKSCVKFRSMATAKLRVLQ